MFGEPFPTRLAKQLRSTRGELIPKATPDRPVQIRAHWTLCVPGGCQRCCILAMPSSSPMVTLQSLTANESSTINVTRLMHCTAKCLVIHASPIIRGEASASPPGGQSPQQSDDRLNDRSAENAIELVSSQNDGRRVPGVRLPRVDSTVKMSTSATCPQHGGGMPAHHSAAGSRWSTAATRRGVGR